jgi:hypothetical protein
MLTPAHTAQLARLIGQEELRRCVGEAAAPARLTAAQVDCLRQIIDERLDTIARTLLEEAVSSDDVVDAGAVLAFVEERLDFFQPLFTERQRGAIRALCQQAVDGWSR